MNSFERVMNVLDSIVARKPYTLEVMNEETGMLKLRQKSGYERYVRLVIGETEIEADPREITAHTTLCSGNFYVPTFDFYRDGERDVFAYILALPLKTGVAFYTWFYYELKETIEFRKQARGMYYFNILDMNMDGIFDLLLENSSVVPRRTLMYLDEAIYEQDEDIVFKTMLPLEGKEIRFFTARKQH